MFYDVKTCKVTPNKLSELSHPYAIVRVRILSIRDVCSCIFHSNSTFLAGKKPVCVRARSHEQIFCAKFGWSKKKLKHVTKSHSQISLPKMSVNRDLCRIHLTKFRDIGMGNVTSLYCFARVMFAEYYHSCEHNSKDNLKEYINKDSLTRCL